MGSPDGGASTQAVNAEGLVTSRKDARGVTASYSYDALNRLTRIRYAGTGVTSQVDAFNYDEGSNGIGRLTSISHPAGDTRWSYDAWGRMLSEVQRVGSVVLKVKKTYDPAGHVTSITYPSGRTLAIMYAGGRPSVLSLDGVVIAKDIVYLPSGPASGWTWGNGSTYRRSFDLYGRMTDYPIGAEQRTLSYDAAGRITAASHTTATLDQNYFFDDLDRLTQATTSTTSRSYAYDLNGNRTMTGVDGTPSNYTVDAHSNRMVSVSGPFARSFTYDAMGNVTGDGKFTAGYEARGRLSRLTAGGRTTAYTYDSLGRRIYKTGGPSGTVDFVYDTDGKLLGDYSGTAQVYNDYVLCPLISEAI
ncbi:MAG: RHS repeat protein [Burkholderiales bacterium]|nr:RHS repeat protein [Burkholderiales bacterium]